MSMIQHLTAGNTRSVVKPVLLTLLSNFLNIVPLVLVLQAVNLLFKAQTERGGEMDVQGLWWVCGALLLYMIVVFWGERLSYRACFRGAYSVSAEGRARLAETLRKLPMGSLLRRDPGDLANMLMGDFTLIEHHISHSFPQLAGALVMPLLAFVGLAVLDWRMALAMFAALPIGLVILALTTRILRSLGHQHMAAKIHAGNRMQEYLLGIQVIKAYNLVGPRFTRLKDAFHDLMRESIRLEATLGPFVLLAIASIRAGLTVMILVGVHLLLGGTLDPLIFVTFLVIGSRIFDPLTAALVNYAELRYASLAGERILSLHDEPAMTGEAEPPESCEIQLRDVSFSYGNKQAIDNLSLVMKPGSLNALVGPSGGGKTTVLKLLARFYDPQAGNLYLGGQPLTGIDPERLMAKISMVFQDVYLFQDSIANNIAFGRRGATREDVIEAAKKACCHDFIIKLPEGYDTPVGEGGRTLSGGEKQRISIARAFIKNAPIVLLDEATSSLDPENERDIQKAIDTLVKGRTVVMVAHRLKTIQRADRIFVLDDGKLCEQGTHEELLKHKGLYAKLWDLQQQSQGWTLSKHLLAV